MKKITLPPVKPRKPSTKAVKVAARKKVNRENWQDPQKKAEAAKPIPKSISNRNFTELEKALITQVVLDNLENGWSLHRACREAPAGGLGVATFQAWLRQDEGLTAKYTQSRLRGYLMLAEDIQEIADNPHEGITTTTIMGPNGVEEKITKEDMLGHRQLQVATRKWLLSKMLPKVFGDRIAVAAVDPEALNDTLKALAAKLPV